MRFERRHDQMNLIEKDIITIQAGQTVPPIKDDEVFEISEFIVFTALGSFEFSESKNVREIIESSNFFTILDGDDRHVMCINRKKVEHFEMVLKNPVITKKGGGRKQK